MARKSTRPKLVLTPDEVRLLEQLRQSRTAAWREVQRAQVLWLYYTGSNIATIMKAVKMTRKSVSKWIEKPARHFGSEIKPRPLSRTAPGEPQIITASLILTA